MASVKNNTLARGTWIKATFLGWLLGVILIIFLSSVLDSIGIEHLQFYIGIGMGAGIGFTQWRVLRKKISMNMEWILYSILGLGIPFLVFDYLLSEIVLYKLPLSVALGGVFTGVLQFLILRKHYAHAAPWILRCFAGWTTAALSVFVINYTMSIRVPGKYNLVLAFVNLTLILIGGLILGLITAPELQKQVKRS